MTAICLGRLLDMIAIPAWQHSAETIVAMGIADEGQLALSIRKTTAVRIIPKGKEG